MKTRVTGRLHAPCGVSLRRKQMGWMFDELHYFSGRSIIIAVVTDSSLFKKKQLGSSTSSCSVTIFRHQQDADEQPVAVADHKVGPEPISCNSTRTILPAFKWGLLLSWWHPFRLWESWCCCTLWENSDPKNLLIYYSRHVSTIQNEHMTCAWKGW